MLSLQEIDSLIQRGDLQSASAGIIDLVRRGKSAEGRHVFYAHILLATGAWPEISALLPTGTNSLLETGWINSVMRGRPVNKAGQPIPWFTYPAIDFLEGLEKKNWNVFEWGSGNSTLWWASQCAQVVAIEDNAQWYSEVKGQLPANADYLLAADQQAYLAAIETPPGRRFDIVVIDGSHRNLCAVRCLPYLSETAIVIYDNSDCCEHDEGLALLAQAGLYRLDFWGLIPSYLYRNCTSLFLKDPTILQRLPTPSALKSTLGPSCGQAIDALQGRRPTL